MRLERLLAILLSVLCAGTARPGEIILESSLNSLDLRESSLTRLEMGLGAYRGGRWTGLRNTLRIERAAGASSAWSMTLPWIYSSEATGLGRRGNLRGGFAWSPPALSLLRLSGEAWLPFSDDRLAPLQLRRGFLRWSLRARTGYGSQELRLCLSHTNELRGLIGEEEDEPWDSWNEGEVRWSYEGIKRIAPYFSARTAFRGSEALWTEVGGGFSLRGSESWRLEIGAAAFISDLDDPFPAARLRLELRRDFPDPMIEEGGSSGEDLSGMAEEAAKGDEGKGDENMPPEVPPDKAPEQDTPPEG